MKSEALYDADGWYNLIWSITQGSFKLCLDIELFKFYNYLYGLIIQPYICQPDQKDIGRLFLHNFEAKLIKHQVLSTEHLQITKKLAQNIRKMVPENIQLKLKFENRDWEKRTDFVQKYHVFHRLNLPHISANFFISLNCK